MINGKNSTILENWCVLTDKNGVSTGIYCGELPVYSSEFYHANQNGIMPQKALLIHSDEYEGQSRCLYEDIKYTVYRYYRRPDGFTELYLTQKAGA